MAQEERDVFDQQIEDLDKKNAQEKKALQDKKQLCEVTKIYVIKELEKEYDFKGFKDFMIQFDEFLNLLDDHFKTNTDASKKAVMDKMSILNKIKKW
jgi:enolase